MTTYSPWSFLLVRPSHSLCRLIPYLAVPFSQCSRLSPRHPSLLSLSPSLHVLTLAHGFIWPCSYLYTNDSQCLSFDQFYLLYIGSLRTTIYLKSPHGLLKDISDLTSPRSNSWSSILSKPVYLPGFLYWNDTSPPLHLIPYFTLFSGFGSYSLFIWTMMLSPKGMLFSLSWILPLLSSSKMGLIFQISTQHCSAGSFSWYLNICGTHLISALVEPCSLCFM